MNEDSANDGNPTPLNNGASPAVAAPANNLPGPMAVSAAEEAGLAVLPSKTVRDLCALGVQAKNFGLTKIASGGLICTMERVSEMQEIVLELARKSHADKTKLAAAAAMAGLAKAMHGCAAAVNADGLVSAEKPAKGPRRRLAASVAVSPTPA